MSVPSNLIWVKVIVVTHQRSYLGQSYCSNTNKLESAMSQQGPLRRIGSLGALGEGSGWDLRVCPSAAEAEAAAASGNLGTWKSRCFGQNKNFRLLTHSRDLGAILPPN